MRLFYIYFSTHVVNKNFTAAYDLLSAQCKKPLTPSEISDLNNILRDLFASNPDEIGIFFRTPHRTGISPIQLIMQNFRLNDTLTIIIESHRATEGDKEDYGEILIDAALQKKWPLCKLLMDQGASFEWSIRSVKACRYTALHCFASNGQTALALQAIRLGADMTFRTEEKEELEQLAVNTLHWGLLTHLLPTTKNISAYSAVFVKSAKAKQWEFCRQLLLKETNLSKLREQRIREDKDFDASALYYFVKEGRLALAAHFTLGRVIYADENPLIKLISHFYLHHFFDQLYGLIRRLKTMEDAIRKDIVKELRSAMDFLPDYDFYTAALTTQAHDNFLEKYDNVRPGTHDIDWALCGAIQQDSRDEANFLLDQGADLLYAWIGAVIAGKTEVFDYLETKTMGINTNYSPRTSSVAMFPKPVVNIYDSHPITPKYPSVTEGA